MDKTYNHISIKGTCQKATLLKQLMLHRMENDEDVQNYMQKFFDTVDRLNNMDVIINQDLLTVMLLYSLPPKFKIFRCAIETTR